MTLFQLIYMSSLVNPDSRVVTDILDTSVRNNSRNNITGMMLYADGSIVQVLEGDRSAVMDTFSRILVDMRHVGIFVLFERETSERDFGCWSMGYKHLSKADIERSGAAAPVFEIRDKEFAGMARPSDALQVLKSFASSITQGR
jgi:hypothetical protein